MQPDASAMHALGASARLKRRKASRDCWVEPRTLGISIVDQHLVKRGKIRINFDNVSDHYRKLARKLLTLRFELKPRRGYWK